MVEIRRLPGPFGVEIAGLDAAQEPDEVGAPTVVKALHDHQVPAIHRQFNRIWA
jgi:hypothetical protein